MDALGSVLNVIEVVKKAVSVYKKIQDCPEQMQIIGQRMERLSSKLTAVKDLLQTQQIIVNKDRTDVISRIVNQISNDSERSEALFTKWKNDVGPFNLQFRFKHLTNLYFALGSSAGELKTLGENIDKYNLELDGELQLLCTIGINKMFVAMGGEPATQTSSAPIPMLPRKDCTVIFVDPYNRGRSIIAEGYLKLVRDWTLRTGGNWSIKTAHSSGLFVRHRGAHTDILGSMRYRYPGYKLDMIDGNQPPEPLALAALFDNKLFDYPSKPGLKKHMQARRSLGISKDIFKTYDYIMVFTAREYDNLLRLRLALIERDGEATVTAEGKGRITYLARGSGGEILNPKDLGDRAQWDAKCSEIKTAVKRFLTTEMGWKQPIPGAKLLY